MVPRSETRLASRLGPPLLPDQARTWVEGPTGLAALHRAKAPPGHNVGQCRKPRFGGQRGFSRIHAAVSRRPRT